MRRVESVEARDGEEFDLTGFAGELEVAVSGSKESRCSWMCLESSGAMVSRLSWNSSTSGTMKSWASGLRFIVGASER